MWLMKSSEMIRRSEYLQFDLFSLIITYTLPAASTHTMLSLQSAVVHFDRTRFIRAPIFLSVVLIILGDVTDSTGMVQAPVARRRSRLRHQRKLYNNWQTTKPSFRSVSS